MTFSIDITIEKIIYFQFNEQKYDTTSKDVHIFVIAEPTIIYQPFIVVKAGATIVSRPLIIFIRDTFKGGVISNKVIITNGNARSENV